ncbi:MAG: hypothetical protein AAF603_10365, partial [Pseudomonadota bacterium]
MWEISHHTAPSLKRQTIVYLFVVGLSFLTATAAQETSLQSQNAQPIIIPSQSSVYNQNSVFLPTAPNVSGQDVIRGADGTSCQSAISSGGPYVDLGVIGSEDVYERSTAALYGRIVVPLGKRARRVDCTKLYQLEINRMQMEIELLRMGAMMGAGEGGELLTDDGPYQEIQDADHAGVSRPKGVTIGGPQPPAELPAPAILSGDAHLSGEGTMDGQHDHPPASLVIPQSDVPLPSPQTRQAAEQLGAPH